MARPLLVVAFAACLLTFIGCQRDAEHQENIEQPTPAASVEAEPAPIVNMLQRPELNLDERGRALRGYDPVAYFTEGKAILGDEAIRETWDGADYMFATEANRAAFVEQPQRYLPAHGGFCTFGIVLEKKFDGDPEVWVLHDDELHVFLNQEVRGKFLSDESNFARVEANWPRIRDQTAQELEEASAPSAASDA